MFSVTFDCGGEFTFHDILKSAGVDKYFCKPGCPNQKVLVENRNGMTRFSLEKSFDFRNLTQSGLNHFVNVSINDNIVVRQNCSPFDCLREGLLDDPAKINAEADDIVKDLMRQAAAMVKDLEEGHPSHHMLLEDRLFIMKLIKGEDLLRQGLLGSTVKADAENQRKAGQDPRNFY